MSNDSKPAPGTTVYRPSGSQMYHADRVDFWIHIGKVSPCGEWVDVGDGRYPLTRSWLWRTRRVDAEADVADSIEATGRAYIRQAEELRRRAAT